MAMIHINVKYALVKGMDELMYDEGKFEIGNVQHTYKLQNRTSAKESP